MLLSKDSVKVWYIVQSKLDGRTRERERGNASLAGLMIVVTPTRIELLLELLRDVHQKTKVFSDTHKMVNVLFY